MDRVRRTVGCDRLDTSQYNGRGVYVVVLDSGVASHPDLDGRIVEFQDFIHGRKQSNSKSNGCVLKLGNVIEEKI